MLADELEYVIGVDPHRDAHALAVVDAGSGGLAFETQVAATAHGYLEALASAQVHAPGQRAWAIEGTGCYGAGLARFLAEQGELVVEVGRLRRQRRSQAKTDALDALWTARSVLGETRLATPRAGGERDGLRALMVARESALIAKKACLCQLRALIVTCPEPLRAELTPLTRARLLSPLAWGMTAAMLGTLFANAFYLTMSFYYFYVFVMLLLALPIVFGDHLEAVAPGLANSPAPAPSSSQRAASAPPRTTGWARTQSTATETG
jgi:hypothetical protein